MVFVITGSGVTPLVYRSTGFCIHVDSSSANAKICSAVEGQFILKSSEVYNVVPVTGKDVAINLPSKFLNGAADKFLEKMTHFCVSEVCVIHALHQYVPCFVTDWKRPVKTVTPSVSKGIVLG